MSQHVPGRVDNETRALARSTRVFELMSRNDLTDPDEQLPPLLAFEDRVLDEDLDVLEPYEVTAVSTDLRQEVSVRSDRLSVAYRRILGELVDHHAGLVPG
ncbi:MAG: hypothetical protein ABW219_00185 [Ilumatobacteraceae bacterium]